MENITKFETGKTYVMSWIGDFDLKTFLKVDRRTQKTVWLSDNRSNEKYQCRVGVYNGVECVSPTGKYSMSPSLYANKLAA